jgi:hypothetical protein
LFEVRHPGERRDDELMMASLMSDPAALQVVPAMRAQGPTPFLPLDLSSNIAFGLADRWIPGTSPGMTAQ